MQFLRKYEIMILLNEKFNDDELRSWSFNYAKNLRRFNVCDISVISRGKHELSYPIKNKNKGKVDVVTVPGSFLVGQIKNTKRYGYCFLCGQL